MVSVNYNIKINTKKTNVLRVSKGSESAMKIVFAGEIIEQVKEFCYLGYMISDDAIEKSREGNLGSWIRVIKFRFLQANFRKISISSGNFTKEYIIEFCRQISENSDFFRQLKKLIFQKMSIYSYLLANYSISLQK